MALAQGAQGGNVVRVGDGRDGVTVMGGVLGRRERVGISRYHGRVLGESGDDVIALAHPGEEDPGGGS